MKPEVDGGDTAFLPVANEQEFTFRTSWKVRKGQPWGELIPSSASAGWPG